MNAKVIFYALGIVALFSSPVYANGGIDRVPEEYASIQEALDFGTAPIIRVAAGKYDGAVINRKVKLFCQGVCEITTGVEAKPNQDAGLILLEGASGSSIDGFDFVAVDLGIFSSCVSLESAANDVTVTHNLFYDTSQGVTVSGRECGTGDGWTIAHNRFIDLRSDIGDCGGGLGIYLIQVDHARIRRNHFSGTLYEPPCGSLFSTSAIYLSGCNDAVISRNRFRLKDDEQLYKFDIILYPEDGPNTNIVVTHNDSRRSDAPYYDINFVSADNYDVKAWCNTGTAWLNHTNTEGTNILYEERLCHKEELEIPE